MPSWDKSSKINLVNEYWLGKRLAHADTSFFFFFSKSNTTMMFGQYYGYWHGKWNCRTVFKFRLSLLCSLFCASGKCIFVKGIHSFLLFPALEPLLVASLIEGLFWIQNYKEGNGKLLSFPRTNGNLLIINKRNLKRDMIAYVSKGYGIMKKNLRRGKNW